MLSSEKSNDEPGKRQDSSEPMVAKAQQVPFGPWSLTELTLPSGMAYRYLVFNQGGRWQYERAICRRTNGDRR